MIFKLHYWCVAAGANAMGILISVFVGTYTDASPSEIGLLLMLMPFSGIIFRPVICSIADREQAHKKYLIYCLWAVIIGYSPYIIIPLIGPSLYEVHPRLSFYILVIMKVIGDVAFGGVVSIGDSLAINYAKRIGTEFNVYRIWGTVSWMVFGLIIGQVNEIWFLPKYVPGFIILLMCSFVNMFIIWLWPDEYFRMISIESSEDTKKDNHDHIVNGGSMGEEENKSNKITSAMTKSLMPKEVVLSHMKHKLYSVFTFRCNQLNEPSNNIPDIVVVEHKDQHKQRNKINCASKTGSLSQRSLDSFDWTNCSKFSVNIDVAHQEQDNITKRCRISKSVQLKILLLLIRRDLRIVPYMLFFVCCGSTLVPLSFLMMNLSEICHTNDRCEFSFLAGLLQVSMAGAETIYLLYSSRIFAKFGRIKLSAVAYMLVFVKFLFYATLWESVNPYYALIAELPSGLIFATWLIISVELGHKFSNEVEYIMPELSERGLIKDELECESLKLSLAATMQAMIASFEDGCGRGFGALIYGIIVEKFSFKTLWLCVSMFGLSISILLWIVALADFVFDFRLGLDVQAEDRARKEAEKNKQMATVIDGSDKMMSLSIKKKELS